MSSHSIAAEDSQLRTDARHSDIEVLGYEFRIQPQNTIAKPLEHPIPPPVPTLAPDVRGAIHFEAGLTLTRKPAVAA